MSRHTINDRDIHYLIQVREKLDPKWSDWFSGFSITDTIDKTILEGVVADQSALYGLLVKIHNLGLTLIRLERLS